MRCFVILSSNNNSQVTVMIHLTTMLVMYTLYQGLQDIMPKTAYLKFIDIFLLYGLIVPFVTFMVEVASKLLGGKENNNEKENDEDKLRMAIYTSPGSKGAFGTTLKQIELSKKKLVPTKEKIRRCLEYTSEKVIPMLTIIFLSGYSVMAVYYYING